MYYVKDPSCWFNEQWYFITLVHSRIVTQFLKQMSFFLFPFNYFQQRRGVLTAKSH